MSEMIERVAKAINDVDGCYVQPQPWHYIEAKAAIEAMCEPTEEMLEAGAYDLDMKLETQYKNMIDAALKE